jgi:hypothetical protein
MRFTDDLALRLAVLFILSVWPASAPADQPPEGWFLAGSHPQNYSAGTTSSVSQEGKASAYLASGTPPPDGFGTLMQSFGADSYRGRRLRMTGFVKAEAVDGWAGLWMRVDGPQQPSLGFDNMQDRPIKGTGDWQRCDVVLDVPQESTQIAFGILLHGGGKVYLDNVSFEVVPSSVPTTDLRKKSLASVPMNLNFEK